MRSDAFSAYHPLAGCLFFALVLGISMCVLHPAAIVMSFLGAFAYDACLRGLRTAGKTLLRLLPLLLFAALLNPAFSHRGVTILAYLPSGNPLTAESIWYGAAAAGRLGAVLLWFACCGAVMTEDKLLYLLGRVSPALSLLLSMSLRFVPRFRAQLAAVYEAQRINCAEGGRFFGVQAAVRAFSAVVTWAMEHGVEIADSMRSRGYGLEGRTAFSLYRLDARDKRMLVWLAVCALALGAGALAGCFAWRYYPRAGGAGITAFGTAAQGVYGALCLTPTVLHGREARLWKRLRLTA